MWYEFHPYWSTKDCNSIRKCINKFSKKNEVVLDSFMGAGTVVMESLMSKRKAIGSDLNPFAVFLTKSVLDYVNLNDMRKALKKIKENRDFRAGWFPKNIPIFIENRVKNVDIGNFISGNNLTALSGLYDSIQSLEVTESVRNSLKICFTSTLTQIVPNICGDELILEKEPFREKINLMEIFEKGCGKFCEIKRRMNRLVRGSDYKLFVSSASNLHFLKNESVDFVFIDPPYSVPYLNLSSIWCSWLRLKINFHEEFMLAKDGFEERMVSAVKEIERVLKGGRYFTINYVDKKPKMKESLLEIIGGSGFTLFEIEKKSLENESLITFEKN